MPPIRVVSFCFPKNTKRKKINYQALARLLEKAERIPSLLFHNNEVECSLLAAFQRFVVAACLDICQTRKNFTKSYSTKFHSKKIFHKSSTKGSSEFWCNKKKKKKKSCLARWDGKQPKMPKIPKWILSRQVEHNSRS